eukprot:m.18209 g.18209  ORF g.18209 m.18209 type:complete len:205 (+) comp4926_c0_seq1:115-729(+)
MFERLGMWMVRGVIGWFKPSVVRVLLLACFVVGTLIFLSLPRTDASVLKREESKHPPREWFFRRHLTSSSNETCRFSRLNGNWVVDENGFVCKFQDLSKRSCCEDVSNKFVCDSCEENHCCTWYEHCVSCCLDPIHVSMRNQVFASLSQSQKRVLTLASDQFDYCELKCRSDSTSVHHENKFRDISFVHCFGKELPEVKDKQIK